AAASRAGNRRVSDQRSKQRADRAAPQPQALQGAARKKRDPDGRHCEHAAGSGCRAGADRAGRQDVLAGAAALRLHGDAQRAARARGRAQARMAVRHHVDFVPPLAPGAAAGRAFRHAALAGPAVHPACANRERRHRFFQDPDRPRGRGRDPGHDLTRRKSRGEVALTAKIGQSPAPAHGAEMPAGDTGGNVAAGGALPDVAALNSQRESTDFDVIIVGAGLSGIGVAYHLQRDCPRKSFIILEARSAIGGTWDLFRYPGVRSDSDMHTLGYRFRPWRGEESIAGGPAILAYLEDTAREYGIERKIRFRHKVTRASWSSEDARWTLDVMGADGGMLTYTCNFLQMCSGYYDYDAGYMPGWPGMERFQGEILHPQQWPEDLDYAGKRVVVIGSGATAVTLVPAMTDKAAHVTMLQRSPTYIVARPAKDATVNRLYAKLPERLARALARWKYILL